MRHDDMNVKPLPPATSPVLNRLQRSRKEVIASWPGSRLGRAYVASELDAMRFFSARFPRLVRMMQHVAILSDNEATAGLRDYVYARDGITPPDLMRWGGGEAVSHFGGPLKTIRCAIKARHLIHYRRPT